MSETKQSTATKTETPPKKPPRVYCICFPNAVVSCDRRCSHNKGTNT